MKSKRTKALSISPKVRQAVIERHNGRCLLCGDVGTDIAHYLSRGAQGGLGIEQNLVLLCRDCHFRLDQTTERKSLLIAVKHYLEAIYPGFRDEDRRYDKWRS